MTEPEATITEDCDRKIRILAGVGLVAALTLLVVASFGVGFGAYVVIMTPDVIFGADHQGTPYIVAALVVGGLFELVALMGAIQAIAHFGRTLHSESAK